MLTYENEFSEVFSIEGKSTVPELVLESETLYYGLCKTYTANKKELTLKNLQKTPIEFKIDNSFRFYTLEFYDFY